MIRKERWVKKIYRRGFWFVAQRVMCEIDEKCLKERTIVFSPHPDDETLGCGGTITKMRALGGDVTIVVMTDGRRSHHKFISENRLKALRAEEAIQANKVLGGKKAHLIFFEFEDGKLMKNKAEAIEKVRNILQVKEPRQVFIPYDGETPSDHLAANQIVMEAIKGYEKPLRIYQYPIWFWTHWPWVGLPKQSIRSFVSGIKYCLISGYRLAKDFRSFVCIESATDTKRDALAQYKTQMTRISGNPEWPILHDVANGEFLECFFQDREIFYQCK